MKDAFDLAVGQLDDLDQDELFLLIEVCQQKLRVEGVFQDATLIHLGRKYDKEKKDCP